MTNQYCYDKNAVDIIISTLKNVDVIREEENQKLYFRGKDLGCNDDGVYLSFNGDATSLVMRGLAIPFDKFSWWQHRRLVKFFRAKYKAFKHAQALHYQAYHEEAALKALNTTLVELVKHGK